MTAFYPSCKIISSILDKYDILIFKKPNVDFTQCVNQAAVFRIDRCFVYTG